MFKINYNATKTISKSLKTLSINIKHFDEHLTNKNVLEVNLNKYY